MQRSPTRFAVFACTLLPVLLVACPTTPIGDCRTDATRCSAAQRCGEQDGACVDACTADPPSCQQGCRADPTLCTADQRCLDDGSCADDCADDSDCADGEVCSPDGACGPAGDCRDDASLCADDELCDPDGGCIDDCRDDPAACAANESCGGDGRCAPDCRLDATLCIPGETCGADGTCESGCELDPTICGATEVCADEGTCVTDCRTDAALCSGDTVCDVDTGLCLADCRDDASVCGADDACDPATGSCDPDCALDPSACAAGVEVCGPDDVCVADCRADPSTCAAGEACNPDDGLCAEDCALDPSACSAGVEVCGPDDVCVGDCRADPSTCAADEACDPATGACGDDCVLDPSVCTSVEVCGPDDLCIPDCRVDPATCAAAEACDPGTGVCDDDCALDPTVCTAGAQVCGPDDICIADCRVDPAVCGTNTVCDGADGLCVPDCRVFGCVDPTTEECAAVDGLCRPCQAANICGADCCDSTEVCRFDTCLVAADIAPCIVDADCANDTRCENGECIPFGVGEVANPQCSVLVPIGVFSPAIQCEWQPQSSLTPCTTRLDGSAFPAGNANYPHGLGSQQCTGREVCVDQNVTDASTARVCFDPHRQVLSTTMVVNFAFPVGSSGNPSGLVGGRPSIVFSSYDALDGGNAAGTSNGVIRIVDGATCATLYTIEGTDPVTSLPLFTMGSSPLALGDIDLAADGRPEIVAHAHGGGLWAFTYDEAADDFTVLWHSTNADGSLNQFNRGTRSVDAFGFEVFTIQHWSGPALHDLDDDGFPEVMMSSAVFDADGRARFIPSAALESDMRFIGTGQFPAIADVDLDGAPDLVTGDKIFTWTTAGPGLPGSWVAKASFTLDPGLFDGYVAIGDFGSFNLRSGAADPGLPEHAIVNGSAGGTFVESTEGRKLFGPFPLPGGGVGGPPTIGDFDGDGFVEYAEAGGRAYTVFDFECAVTPPTTACTADAQCGVGLHCPAPGRCSLSSTECTVNADCAAPQTCIVLSASRVCVPSECEGNGFRWSRISQDLSSNRSGSSIFDFEGDGKSEAVYSDECYTRVYDGDDGTVLFSQFHTSCTWYEGPIVADVDGDLRSEIVIGSNENCSTGSTCFANAFTVSLGPDGVVSNDDTRVDPIFPGIRCGADADCPGGGCVDELCRCTSDLACGGGDFVCSPTLAGSTTVTNQNVCRAAFRLDTTDGRPGITGVRVYRDVADRWVGSRPIWNQHTYSITHVEDDGSLPRSSDVEENWLAPGLNNYRQNSQGTVDPTLFPDVTAGGNGVCLDEDNLTLRLSTNICNRGAADVGASVPIAFYLGTTATPAALVCLEATTMLLSPGQCEGISCDLQVPPSMALDYLIVADDDGTGAGQRAECVEGNNQGFINDVGCF